MSTYYYRLKAVNAAGESPWSNVISVATTPEPQLDADLAAKLGFWLDASEGVEVSNGVTAEADDPLEFWWDKLEGSNKYGFQDVLAQRPILKANQVNGRPAVVFDRTQSSFMEILNFISLAGSNGATVIAVSSNKETTAGNAPLFYYTFTQTGGFKVAFGLGSRVTAGEFYGAARRTYNDSLALPQSGPMVAGEFEISSLVADFPNGEVKFYVGGDLADTVLVTAGTMDSIAMASVLIGTEHERGIFHDGGLAELLYFPEPITADEMGRAHAYVKEKYGFPADPTLELELDADSGAELSDGSLATDGQLVDVWRDQTGYANDMHKFDVGYEPTFLANQANGHPALQFTSGKILKLLTGLGMFRNVGGGTMLVVMAYPNSGDAGQHVISATGAGVGSRAQISIYPSSNGRIAPWGRRLDSDSFQQLSVSGSTREFPVNTYTLIGGAYLWESAQIQVIKEGVVTATGSFHTSGLTSDTDSDQIAIGNSNINIAAIRVFSRVLSSTELSEESQKLMSKYTP